MKPFHISFSFNKVHESATIRANCVAVMALVQEELLREEKDALYYFCKGRSILKWIALLSFPLITLCMSLLCVGSFFMSTWERDLTKENKNRKNGMSEGIKWKKHYFFSFLPLVNLQTKKSHKQRETFFCSTYLWFF